MPAPRKKEGKKSDYLQILKTEFLPASGSKESGITFPRSRKPGFKFCKCHIKVGCPGALPASEELG